MSAPSSWLPGATPLIATGPATRLHSARSGQPWACPCCPHRHYPPNVCPTGPTGQPRQRIQASFSPSGSTSASAVAGDAEVALSRPSCQGLPGGDCSADRTFDLACDAAIVASALPNVDALSLPPRQNRLKRRFEFAAGTRAMRQFVTRFRKARAFCPVAVPERRGVLVAQLFVPVGRAALSGEVEQVP